VAIVPLAASVSVGPAAGRPTPGIDHRDLEFTVSRSHRSVRGTNLLITVVVAGLVSVGSAVAAATVTSQSIRDNSVQSRDIRNHTLLISDLATSTQNILSTSTSELLATIRAHDGAGSRIDADTIDGMSSTIFATDSVPHVEVARNLATQSIPNAVLTSVSFDTEVEDSHDMYSAIHPERMTAPTDGLYLVETTIAWDSAVVGANGIELYIESQSATGLVQQRAFTMKPAAGSLYTSGSTVLRLSAGQWVRIRVRQDSGASVNIDQSLYTYATMTRLGV